MKVCDHQCWARSFKNIYIIEACAAERRFIRSELLTKDVDKRD